MTVTSVGALVVKDDRILVVRLTYSPTKGQYMLPGGVVESGETLGDAVVRETLEETGITIRPIGVIGITSIVYQSETHTYVIWLAEPKDGAIRADGSEVDHCCFMTFEDIASRDDVSYLVKYLVGRVRDGDIQPHTSADDYVGFIADLTPQSFQLYM